MLVIGLFVGVPFISVFAGVVTLVKFEFPEVPGNGALAVSV